MNFEKGNLTVLVVDDEADLRDVIIQSLNEAGYKCLSAADGNEALKITQSEKISLIVSDVMMPNLNGVELLKNIKGKNIPVILLTGVVGDLDLEKATALGAADFLSKPFKRDDLLSSVELALFGKPEGTDEDANDLDSDYCRVHIDDFLTGTKVNQDLYLRLSQSKYLRVAKVGSPMLPERVASYKNKGLQFFHIKKEEFARYVGFNLKVAQALRAGAVKVKKSDKLRVIRQATDVYLEQVFVIGIDRDMYNYGKSLTETALKLTIESDGLYDIMELLRSQSDITYAHSLAVSLYSALIAKAAGWTSATTLFKISMAGLLHDVGKKELPREVLMKTRAEMTAGEIRMYESHPLRSRDILVNVPSTPEEVVLATLQHHEKMNGFGYPSGTPRVKIHPFARIIGLADEFCHHVLKGPYGKGMDPKEAMQLIYPTRSEEYDGFFVRALFQIVGLPVPEKLRNVKITNDCL